VLCRDYKGRRADRLVTRIAPGVVSRVAELRAHERQATEEAGQRRPVSRNALVAALQKRWDRLRVGLDLILDQRGADKADMPGGASGLLARDSKGRNAAGS
jgi:hypothetical protein